MLPFPLQGVFAMCSPPVTTVHVYPPPQTPHGAPGLESVGLRPGAPLAQRRLGAHCYCLRVIASGWSVPVTFGWGTPPPIG